MSVKKNGVLLINLGTPEAPTVSAVRQYLTEFLLDPYVIALPALARYLLVYGLILPFRPKQSAHAYQQIWTDQGSPLLVHSIALKNALQEKWGGHTIVALGMRYGNPSINQAVAQLKAANVEKILALPLFPQYAEATNRSAIEATKASLKKNNMTADILFIEDFYTQPAYINAYAELIKKHLPAEMDFILFSYHGLPTRQLPAQACPQKKPCLDHSSCPISPDQYTTCYRAQCFTTTALIAKQLKLTEEKYATVFQSRLGRAKWIGPYTTEHMRHLRNTGVKNLVIVCPSFVSDCLETLEEIGIRLKADWLAAGGEHFTLIPALNANDYWVNAISSWLSNHL